MGGLSSKFGIFWFVFFRFTPQQFFQWNDNDDPPEKNGHRNAWKIWSLQLQHRLVQTPAGNSSKPCRASAPDSSFPSGWNLTWFTTSVWLSWKNTTSATVQFQVSGKDIRNMHNIYVDCESRCNSWGLCTCNFQKYAKCFDLHYQKMQLLGESPDLKKPFENYGSHMRHSVGRHYQILDSTWDLQHQKDGMSVLKTLLGDINSYWCQSSSQIWIISISPTKLQPWNHQV